MTISSFQLPLRSIPKFKNVLESGLHVYWVGFASFQKSSRIEISNESAFKTVCEDYWPCAGSLSAVNDIGMQSRDRRGKQKKGEESVSSHKIQPGCVENERADAG